MPKHLSAYLRRHSLKWCRTSNMARLAFICLMIFQLLNMVGVLDFNPEYTWRGLFSTSFVIFIALEIVSYGYYARKKALLPGVLWALTFISVALDFSADFFHLYGKFDWWDQMLHFVNSANTCFIVFVIISAYWIEGFTFSLVGAAGRLRLTLWLAAATTSALGAIYEIEEYLEDLIYLTNRSGPGMDTSDDIFLNSLGILVMTLVLYIIFRQRKKKLL